MIVIKHWRINNYLRNDRYQSTTYLEEKETLMLDSKNAYTEKEKLGIPNIGIPSIGKDSIGKDSIDKSKRFTPPTVDEVRAYCQERHNNVDPETFVDFYASKGWKVGNNSMKDWKACVRTWEKRDGNKSNSKSNKSNDTSKLKALEDYYINGGV